ncbi:MAG: hypothetical protein AAFW70_26985 [Cyanobacteria bacterium J06635_10]
METTKDMKPIQKFETITPEIVPPNTSHSEPNSEKSPNLSLSDNQTQLAISIADNLTQVITSFVNLSIESQKSKVRLREIESEEVKAKLEHEVQMYAIEKSYEIKCKQHQQRNEYQKFIIHQTDGFIRNSRKTSHEESELRKDLINKMQHIFKENPTQSDLIKFQSLERIIVASYNSQIQREKNSNNLLMKALDNIPQFEQLTIPQIEQPRSLPSQVDETLPVELTTEIEDF